MSVVFSESYLSFKADGAVAEDKLALLVCNHNLFGLNIPVLSLVPVSFVTNTIRSLELAIRSALARLQHSNSSDGYIRR